MNQSCINDFINIFNKNEVTLYCRKCDPDFVHQNEYNLNHDELLPLIVSDDYLCIEKYI